MNDGGSWFSPALMNALQFGLLQGVKTAPSIGEAVENVSRMVADKPRQ